MRNYKYGVFKKGEWKAVYLFETKEEAEKYVRHYRRYYADLEVRKLL